MRSLIFAAALAGFAAPVAAQADANAHTTSADATASTATKAHYNTGETDIGTLLDDPASRVVIDRHLPGFADNPQLEMARGLTLRALQQYAPDMITTEKLDAIDADLTKIAPEG